MIDGDAPDDGWIPVESHPDNAFQNLVLSAWGRLEGDQPIIGFRVAPKHCNSRGVCHGGMLVVFCDFFLPTAARLTHEQDDSYTPTVSLTTNFLAPAPVGSWTVGHARVLRRTSNLLFVDGLVTADATPVLQVSGIFKRGGADGRRAGSAALLERLQEAQNGAATPGDGTDKQ